MATKTVLGFIAGISAGAILGVLFAPAKGSDTRKKIAGKANDLSDSVKASFCDFMDNLKDTFTKTKEEAGELANDAQNKIETVSHDFKASSYI